MNETSRPAALNDSDSEAEQFEFWSFVHDDEKLGDKVKLIRLLASSATSEVCGGGVSAITSQYCNQAREL